MAKREANWQPDIYDMAAQRADDPSPPTPRPSGRISNLTARWRKSSPAPRPVSDPLDAEADDTSLLLDVADDPLLDDEDEEIFDEAAVSEDAAPPRAKGKPAPAAPPRRRATVIVARPAPSDDNSGLLGLVLGALVGVGLTLLVTPTGGKQLRARLQAEVQHQADQGNVGAKIVAHNMPNTTMSEQTAPVAEAARA